jgi:hypothetical protein
MIGGQLISSDHVFSQRLGQLEPRLRTKYYALEDATEALWNASRAATAAWEVEHGRLRAAQQAHTAAIDADKRDPEMTAQRRHGTYTPGPRLTASAAALKLAEERELLRRQERDRVAEVAAHAGAVLDAATSCLNQSDPTTLQPIIASIGTASSNLTVDLERIRSTLETLDREAKRLAVAPVPVDEALARLERWLDALTARYDPPVLYFTPPHYEPPGHTEFTPYVPVEMWAALPAWRDVLKVRLQGAYAQLPASVPSADRPALAASLAERRRKLEIEEETLVLAAVAQGVTLARRADADPVVVLCVLLK